MSKRAFGGVGSPRTSMLSAPGSGKVLKRKMSIGRSASGAEDASPADVSARQDVGQAQPGQPGSEPQKSRMDVLEADLARRQEAYIRRERALRTRIEELETELEEAKEARINWMRSDKAMGDIKTMHKRIINNVEIVQDRTAKILQEQERDLLRAFRARLFDIQTELEKEKGRKDDGAGAWIEKSRKLEGELDWTMEMADRLDRENQRLKLENARLKTQFKVQEEDRTYLIKQLVMVKKDNAKFRQDLDATIDKLRSKEDEVDRLQAEGALGGLSRPAMKDVAAGVRAETDNRYKEVIRKLKRQLDMERRNSRAVQERLTEELQSRTELQTFLRQCIEDVRKQIKVASGPVNGKKEAGPGKRGPSPEAPNPSIDDFTSADREKVLNLLLSQERVVTLLYGRAFPVRPFTAPESSFSTTGGLSNNASAHDVIFEHPPEPRPVTAPAPQLGLLRGNSRSDRNIYASVKQRPMSAVAPSS